MGIINGCVIWLKGLDQALSIDESLFSKPSYGTIGFQKSEFINRKTDFNIFVQYMRENGDNVEVLGRGIMDMRISNNKVRFITENISFDEFEVYIKQAPNDLNIVFAVKPNCVSKRTIENWATDNNRIMLDCPLPKSDNIASVLKRRPNHLSWECFYESVLCIINGAIGNLLGQLAIKLLL